jgi:RHS repeat-associated protein
MKSVLLSLSAVTVVGGGAAVAAMRWPKEPLTEPDAILEIQSASLTSYLPTASTSMQGVRPRIGQRGAQLDGALRKGNPWGLAMNGNPLVVSSGSSARAGGIDVGNGTAEIFDVDLRLPSKGISWVIGRTYNARQVDSGGTHQDSSGYQGKNWAQMSNPELVLYDADSNTGTKQATDYLYLVYGADRYLEFKRTAANSENFRATNGGAGVIQHVPDTGSEPGYYMYVDQGGNELFFFDSEPFGSADAGSAAMQLWKMVDPAGNVAYFGDPTTASTAITNGYLSGKPSVAIDASDRRYSYTYDGSSRLTRVKVETKTGGTWFSSPTGLATVGQVDYTYYTSDGDTYGDNSDLKLVEINEPLTDSGVSVTKRKYYRYYDFDSPHTSYNASTNPGVPHQIQLIVGFEGCRNYDYAGDATFNQSFYSETTANLKAYADAYFEYENTPTSRITKSFMNGQCGCSGNSNGVFTYSYGNNGSYSDNSGYDTAWMFRTIVAQPDGGYITQYFDEVFQPLSRVFTDADPSNTMPAPSQWATYVHRTSTGLVDEVSTPANVTAYTHSSATFTRSSSVGLIWKYNFIGSSHTTENFVSDRLFQDAGTGGSTYYDRSFTYDYEFWKIDAGDAKSQVVHPLIASDAFYVAKVTTAAGNTTTTSFSYAAQGASNNSQIALKSRTTTEPAVTTGNNGSNSANTTSVYWNADGTLGFEKTALGYITYHEYTDGRETKRIRDADTTRTAGGQDFNGVSIPSGFASSGTPLHHVATMTYDAQGRFSKRTEDSYSPLTYYGKLKDERLVTLQYTNSDGVPTYYGPVGYEVRNQASRSEASGLIGLSSNSSTSALTSMIDETTADVKSAVAVGTLKRLTTRLYDESGTQMSESRLYTTIPGSLPGSSGTNYDATTYVADDMGRTIRTEEPSGTVRRTVYDARGRVSERWVGTNDYGSTGTDNVSGPANILKVESLQYDGGSDKGNDYLTQRTLGIDDTPTTRVTAYTNDAFGKPVLVAPPTTPYTLNLHDNLHRVTATGLFTSTSGLSVSSDPTAISTNRKALDETKFDELGRVWRTIHHKINTSSGADSDSLNSDSWYDADRRVIKVQGGDFEKYFYDRLNRRTHVYTLANSNDAAYTDADDVSGDVVLEEDQTTYDSSDGKVIMRALIQRNHDDVGGGATTGALDTNADSNSLKYTAANVKGRIQITAFWNGLQGVTDQVEYGNNGGSDFDRSGLSAPSRSTTALRTTYVYNIDNTIDTIQDPSISTANYTKLVTDDLGRRITEIRNYQSGVSSGAPTDPDVNVTTRWAYSSGLMTSLTADLPSGQTDQVTTYTYGTTKGTSAGDSKIATGHLLQKITYPDSSDSGDVVKFAYNGQEVLIWKQDQAPSGSTGNVIQSDFDGVGRLTERRVTTVGTNFDNAVLRIETTYDTLGRPQLVTQYDNAAVGSGSVVNEIRFTYDGWGNLTAYEEDPNSAVDAGGSVDDFELDYGYDKNTSGRQTLRRKNQQFNVGTAANYLTVAYAFTSNYDGDISRVSQVKIGANVQAEYEYLGSNFVIGDNRPIPAIFSKQHSLVSSGTYSQLDNFNRRLNDYWTKDLSTDVDYFKVDNTWDENGNVTTTKDNVQAGFDVKYTMDGINRVTEAKEGTLSGGSITSTTRDQQWTLSHTGNWTREKLDLDGNGNFTGTGEHDDTRTHNDVNELTTQDTDSNSSVNNTLSYDPAGNLTDDGVNYKYVYDAFYRLRFIKTQGGAVVEEFTYNGLGHQIGWHYDNDRSGHTGVPDGTVDGNDYWYYKAYDERWRQVATFRSSDATPKEVFVLQQAGDDGLGGASYINGVICRKKDANTTWTTTSDGVLEETEFYCQNWRGDVVCLIDNGGAMTEWAKYSAYGVPLCLPVGDTTSIGARNSASDANQIQTWINGSTYDVRGDTNLDGLVNTTDKNYVMSHAAATGGRGVLSIGTNANRVGLAGYAFDDVVTRGAYHVRHRVLDADRGRWIQRDPFQLRISDHSESDSLYSVCAGQPTKTSDPYGLAPASAGVSLECNTSRGEAEPRIISGITSRHLGYAYTSQQRRVERIERDLAVGINCRGCSRPGTEGCVPFGFCMLLDPEVDCKHSDEGWTCSGVYDCFSGCTPCTLVNGGVIT